MYLDLEVPYQEISAGLGADLRSMARQCEFLVFQPREVGKRRPKRKRREGNEFIHQAWQVGSCQRDNSGRKEHVPQVIFSSQERKHFDF